MAGVPTIGKLSGPQQSAVAALTAVTTGAVPVKTSTGYADSVYTNAGATLATATAAGTGWTLAGAFAPTSGSDAYTLHAINLTINQTGGANGTVTALKVNVTETAAVGADYLCDYQIGGVSKWSIRGTSRIASAIDATWDGYKASALTQPFSGNTRIQTAAGINKIAFYAPTLTSDTATLTVDKASTLYISGAPIAGTNVAITKSLALLVGGNTEINGTLSISNGYPSSLSIGGAGASYNMFEASSSTLAVINKAIWPNLRINGAIGLSIEPSAGSRLHVYSAAVIASAANAMFRGIYFSTETVTISGTTNIDTATGFNKFVIEAPTYSNASITIAKAFTQRIDNAPQVTGGATITARGALLVSAGSIVCQGAALATNAAEGFLYIPSCAGTPTGTPQTHAGAIPLVYDSTNHKLYVYDGGWIGGTAPGAWS